MKKTYLFGMFAALAFASCSSDNEPANTQGVENEAGYIAINIVNPTGTRATDGGFENGTDKENEVTNATFLFFNTTGAQVGTPETRDLNPFTSQDGGNAPNVEKISSVVLLVDGANNNPTYTQLLVILNAPANAGFAGKTLSQVQTMVANYSSCTKGAFIMSNSVYEKGTTGATSITGHIYENPGKATADPVDVYAERVVSKVRTKKDTNFTSNQQTITVTDENNEETTYKLDIEINGIEIANIAKESFLLKNITGITYNWAFENPVTNYRSYWATMPTSEQGFNGYTNKSWNAITDASTGDNAWDKEHNFYIQENTSSPSSTSTPSTTTSVIVSATLKANDKGVTFVEIGGGYMTENVAKNYLATSLKNANFWKKTAENTYESFAPADITWDYYGTYGNKDYYMKGKLAEGLKSYSKKEDGTFEEKAIPADFFTSTTRLAKIWTDGKCYYFKEIEHHDNIKGIVRNHIYDLNLTGIDGLGTPVYDPTREIIPEIPSGDKFKYLAARVKILRWKLVKQDVNFNDTRK